MPVNVGVDVTITVFVGLCVFVGVDVSVGGVPVNVNVAVGVFVLVGSVGLAAEALAELWHKRMREELMPPPAFDSQQPAPETASAKSETANK